MKKAIWLLVALPLLGHSISAQAETCSIAQPLETRIGGWCNQAWVDYFWDHYDFDKSDWDDGFGFSNACNMRKPLGRTFNGIYLLNYADGRGSRSTGDFSGSILNWGGNYSMREIDELDARCGTSKRARTRWGPVIDNWTKLFLPFFYSENPVERAATLLHESRHADWCGHNGNDGSNNCPAGSNSCDEDYYDGCSGFLSPSGRGATGFQALWLWWFTVDAAGTANTLTRREWARDEANRIFDTMFDNDPCFNITSSGAVVNTC